MSADHLLRQVVLCVMGCASKTASALTQHAEGQGHPTGRACECPSLSSLVRRQLAAG